MTIEDRHVLVTGGGGFIGSWIVETLSKTNKAVVLDNFSTGKKENLSHLSNTIKIINGDIRDAKLVNDTANNAEIIFHQAANVQIPASIKDPQMDSEINLGGTMNVLEAARKNDAKRVVFASSSAIYGEPAKLPLKEEHPKKPMSPYAVSKLSAEEYVKLYNELYGIPTVALRYFNVYGPRQNPDSPYSGVISIFTKNMKEGKGLTVFGDGEQTRDFVNVRDVVNANLLAAESDSARGRAINIGTGKTISLNEMIKVLEKLSNKKTETVYKDAREGDIKHSNADISLAKKLLGFNPVVDIEKGLKELI